MKIPFDPKKIFQNLANDKNPFGAAEANDAPENDPESREARAKNLPRSGMAGAVFFVFGAIFFCAGIFVSTLGLKQFLDNRAAAGKFVETPCVIVSAKLEKSRTTKGRSTYSLKISYKYTFSGTEYSNDKLGFVVQGGTNDHARERRRLAEYKAKKTCWVNPDDPAEAILLRPEKEFSRFQITGVIFGIPFMLIGGGFAGFVIYRLLKRVSASAKKEQRETLEKVDKRAKAIPVVAFAVIWNSVVSVFLCAMPTDVNKIMWAAIFVFAAIGIGMAVFAFRKVRALWHPSYEVKISPRKIVPAGTCKLDWKLPANNSRKIKSLRIELCRMKSTIAGGEVRSFGTPVSKIVEKIKILETDSPTLTRAGTCDFDVPEKLAGGFYRLRFSAKTDSAKIEDYYLLERA